MMEGKELIEIMEAPSLICIINGCNQKMDRMVTTEQAIHEVLPVQEIICNNGVGYMHVVSRDGKHVGIKKND